MPEAEPICIGSAIVLVPVAILGIKHLIKSIKETKNITPESVDRMHDLFLNAESIECGSSNTRSVLKRFFGRK